MDWHKGQAVIWLLQRLDLDRPDVLPIYLGDDLTDEDAFRALRERGVGIVVRDEPRPTAARYALENPAEVGSFLRQLMEHSRRQRADEGLDAGLRGFRSARWRGCARPSARWATATSPRAARRRSRRRTTCIIPATYLAGGYNRLKTEIAGRVVENEDLVNLPNWLSLSFRIGDDDWFDLRKVEILSYRQELDLQEGVLTADGALPRCEGPTHDAHAAAFRPHGAAASGRAGNDLAGGELVGPDGNPFRAGRARHQLRRPALPQSERQAPRAHRNGPGLETTRST